MIAKAAVLEAFREPLTMREFNVCSLADGEVLVRIRAAGVCGSDVHMWHGKDPRTPLPMILGHEGVGEVAEICGVKRDVFGRELRPGDPVMWERGIMCGCCYYCVIEKQPALCTSRQTYGISLSCEEPPHLRGCYAEFVHLMPGAHLIRLDEGMDPAVLVAASCSGATAAHAVELSRVGKGDIVLILGPGPLGLFCLAWALEMGAAEVYVAGTAADAGRLELCKQFGAAGTIDVEATTLDERSELVREATNGVGMNAVIDCTGVTSAFAENLEYVAPYGTYSIPGIATPVGDVAVPFFEALSRKNVCLQGVWVSDTAHLLQAVRLVASGRYPFDRLVTHRFPLTQATEALEVMASREAIKAVLIP
ncbi:MAG: zinc-binding dehydrogenase [Armatimonadota bacterium]